MEGGEKIRILSIVGKPRVYSLNYVGLVKQLAILKVKFERFSHNFTKLKIKP